MECKVRGNEMFEGSNMFSHRSSLKRFITKRGIKLADNMENIGLIICNGRSPSDNPVK